MFCERCGRELPDDAIQCPECGRPISGKVIIDTDRRNGKGWPIMILSALASGAVTFCLSYYWNFYFIAFLFPIFLFGGRKMETTLDFVMSGLFIGIVVGCITGLFFKFVVR